VKKPKVFETADFVAAMCTNRYIPEFVAELANIKLQKLIESMPVVYGSYQPTRDGKAQWRMNQSKDFWPENTHKARLAFIEEIPKSKTCSHEPMHACDMHGLSDKNTFRNRCTICGTELVFTWIPK